MKTSPFLAAAIILAAPLAEAAPRTIHARPSSHGSVSSNARKSKPAPQNRSNVTKAVTPRTNIRSTSANSVQGKVNSQARVSSTSATLPGKVKGHSPIKSTNTGAARLPKDGSLKPEHPINRPNPPYAPGNGRWWSSLPEDTQKVIKHKIKDREYWKRWHNNRWYWYTPYYYDDKVYYRETSAPDGAEVDELPEDAEEFTEDGTTYYASEDDVYKKDGDSYTVVDEVESPRDARLESNDPIDLLTAMFKHFESLDSFAFEAMELRAQGWDDGRLPEGKVKRQTFVTQPNMFRTQVTGDDFSKQFWYNGSTATVLDANTKEYVQFSGIPGTINELIPYLEEKHGVSFPLADILVPEALELIKSDMVKAENRGIRKIGGVDCHWLWFTQNTVDWQLWMPLKGDGKFKQLAIQYKEQPGKPVFAVQIVKWSDPRTVDAAHYQIRLPEGAKKVTDLPKE